MALAENIGFSTSNSSAISSLSFLLRTYFEQLCRDSLNSAINAGRAEVGLEDVSYVFGVNGINITELHDYIQQVQPFASADQHPLFPVIEPLNVPPSTEILDISERKNAEKETVGNEGTEVDDEGNREQNNKHSSNSKSNVRSAISQKIFPNFVGAFAPSLGFSVRKVELPTENVSVDRQLAPILPPLFESTQHIIFEFDRCVVQPMRIKATITEEQERLMKKKKKKEKREKEKRKTEEHNQLNEERRKKHKLKPNDERNEQEMKKEKKKEKREKEKRLTKESEQSQLNEEKRKKHKMKEKRTDERNDQMFAHLQQPQILSAEPTIASPPPETPKIEKLKIRLTNPHWSPPPTATTNAMPISSVSDDIQILTPRQSPPPVTTTNVTPIRVPILRQSTPPPPPPPTISTNVTPIRIPLPQQSLSVNATPILSVPEDKIRIALSQRSPPPPVTIANVTPTVSLSEDKRHSPAPSTVVTSSGRSVKPSKRKFEETEAEKPVKKKLKRETEKPAKKKIEEMETVKPTSTKGQTKDPPKTSKMEMTQKVTTNPSFSTTDRCKNSAEKVRAIAKAVEQIAAAHFSGAQSTKTPAENAVATNNATAEEEEEDIWICPTCSVAYVEGQEMVACDDCDRWYHWGCVGILIPPPEKAQWYCAECRRKRKKAAQRQQTSAGAGGSGSNSRKSSFSGGGNGAPTGVTAAKKQRIAKT